MFRKVLLSTTIVILTAGQAIASSCPKQMAAVDAALATTKISAADKTKVMGMRKKGEMQHKSGDHAGSVKTLAEAKKILGMKM